MIKFIGTKDGKRLYGFGLSRRNMDKLLESKPIFIDLDVMAMKLPPNEHIGCVLIFGGKTEQAMVDDLGACGVLDSGVDVNAFEKNQR